MVRGLPRAPGQGCCQQTAPRGPKVPCAGSALGVPGEQQAWGATEEARSGQGCRQRGI